MNNEGDVDLDPFLKPLLNAAGGNLQNLELESLRRAQSDGTLSVVGVKLWTAMLSDTWRHREAAAEALSHFLQQDKMPDKY